MKTLWYFYVQRVASMDFFIVINY